MGSLLAVSLSRVANDKVTALGFFFLFFPSALGTLLMPSLLITLENSLSFISANDFSLAKAMPFGTFDVGMVECTSAASRASTVGVRREVVAAAFLLASRPR